MAGASLANPFGWDLFDKVLGLVQSGYIRSSIVEWTPVYAVDFVKTKSFVFYILYFLLLADSLVQRTANQPVRIYLLAVIFLVLSIDANRNVAWFAVAGSYVLAHTLDRSPRLTQRRERNTVWFAAVLLIGSASTLYFGNVAGKTLGLRDESPLSAQATDAATAQIGYLRCDVAGGVSFVFGSTRDLECVYTAADTDLVEHYSGKIKTYGIDIGFRESGVMIWGVFASQDDPGPGALAGEYGGVTAGVAVGVGLGADALLGGSDRGIGLQPLSITGFTGLNVAAGVSGLELKAGN